jgi:hypothetical protein
MCGLLAASRGIPIAQNRADEERAEITPCGSLRGKLGMQHSLIRTGHASESREGGRGRTALDNAGKVVRIDGISPDVTERRLQSQKIARLSWIGAILSGISTTITRVEKRDALFREACQLAVHEGGFEIAWIGVHDRDCGQLKGWPTTASKRVYPRTLICRNLGAPST